MTRQKRVTKARKKPQEKPQAGAAGTGTGRSSKGSETLSLMAAAEERKSRYASIEQVLKMYRPVKKPVTMRIDADVLAWFRRGGRRYQTRINWALRRVMAQEMKKQEREGG